MDSNKIIKHLYISSKNAVLFAKFFNHIVGVISVYKGKIKSTGEDFIHIAFDDLNVTFEKLILAFISISKEDDDNIIVIYTDGENNSEIENALKYPSLKDVKIEVKEFSEYVSHSPVIKNNFDLLSYLAFSDEAGERTKTREGAIGELNDTKKAMLNLLEDAYEAQDKILLQADNLKTALAEAERERLNYLLFISSIGEGVIVLTPDGKVNIANKTALGMFGLAKEEVYGKKLSETLEIKDRSGEKISAEFINKILTTEEILAIPPLIIKRRNGTTFTVSTTASPVKNNDKNENIGVILTFRDIGEELALEEARINFISTASHQLRTPLTSMRWFSEMLYSGEAGVATEEQKQYLDQINQGITRMINLVNYLLRTARVESNRTAILPKNINITQYINEGAKKYEEYFKSKKQTIKVTSVEVPEIPLDPDYLNEVLTNIFSNASIYGKVGDEIIVNIGLEGNFAFVSVTDHGIGIKDEDKSRVFEKFFRSEDAIIASPDGSGLGLAFTSMLVKEWGGEISFISEVNVGTTFTVTIPLSGMKERQGEVKLTE